MVAAAAVVVAFAWLIASYFFVRKQSEEFDDSRSCLYFRRCRRTPSHKQQLNLAPSSSAFSPSSDPISRGITLPPDDEPEQYQDEPILSYRYRDDPVLINIGPPKDEDGHELHNVNFLS